MTSRQCLHCTMVFQAKREDHFFCSGRCVAAFYRVTPNPNQIHRDLPKTMPVHCKSCGLPYKINAYANRKGQRAPKYCGNACRQRAYRENKREAGQRRQENTWHYEYDFRSGSRDQERRSQRGNRINMSEQRACHILGVSSSASLDAIKSAYRQAMKRVHPDVYRAADATQKAQEVNEAYEWFKRYRGAK